jgi:glycosyltransferase involved in cell wall biosynthesis
MAKIVHFTTVHSAFDVRIFYRECRALAQSGYEVTEIAPGDSNEKVDGVDIIAIRKPGGRLLRPLLGAWAAYRRAAAQHADLYHFHDPELIPLGLLLRSQGHRVIYDVHENVANDILDKHWIPGWLRPGVSRLAAFLERLAARAFSGIVAAAPELADGFRCLNPNVISVENFPLADEFPEPIDATRFRSGIVVNFGGVTPLRVTRELVQAMGLLPAEVPARLVLAGAADSQALVEEISRLPGWARVEYRGMVVRATMLSLLAGAAAAVVLYSEVPNHMDVRSNRLFESMAAGLPVITSNFPKWRELIEGAQCGLTVNPASPAEIAAALRYLLTHPEEAVAMGRRGRQLFKERFNWEQETPKMVSLYQRLLNGKGADCKPGRQGGHGHR